MCSNDSKWLKFKNVLFSVNVTTYLFIFDSVRKMAITIDQIILDAKRIVNRLKDQEALGDSLLIETDSVNKQIESQKEVLLVEL